MRRRAGTWAMLLASILLACTLPPAAHAAGGASDIPQITDRYASINDLTTSRSEDDRVVVATTVPVLTSVNRALDGLTVRFSGEAVGDVLAADADHRWVNVLGASGQSIGVYMTSEEADLVVNLGDYNTSGTTLEIEGVYTIACSGHQGELDIHATSVKRLDAGGKITHVSSRRRFGMAVGLCAAGFALLATFIALRRHAEKRKLDEKGPAR